MPDYQDDVGHQMIIKMINDDDDDGGGGAVVVVMMTMMMMVVVVMMMVVMVTVYCSMGRPYGLVVGQGGKGTTISSLVDGGHPLRRYC